MTDIIVNIGGEPLDESNLASKFGDPDAISMCKQVTFECQLYIWLILKNYILEKRSKHFTHQFIFYDR